MELCLKFSLIFLISVVVQVSSKPIEEYIKIEQEYIKLGIENADLRNENFRLKGEILNLTQKIEKLTIERENCTALADNIDMVSTSLDQIQEDLKPLSMHFNHKFKTNATISEPVQDMLTKKFAANEKVMSDRLNLFMDELKSYVKEHDNTITKENQILLNELKTAKENLTTATVQAHNMTTTLTSFVNELKTKEIVSNQTKLPKTCAEAARGQTGVFLIEIPGSSLAPFHVYCDSDNWMVILRRVDATVGFERNWAAFREGFGDITGNFIMGLEKLHQITKLQCHELKVELENFQKLSAYASYDQFGIDDESHAYALTTLGKYTGNAGDSLEYHKGAKFTTYDRDNDESHRNCAETDKGAWWHKNCNYSKLTGEYITEYSCRGIEWFQWRGCEPMKYAKMMIRPTTC